MFANFCPFTNLRQIPMHQVQAHSCKALLHVLQYAQNQNHSLPRAVSEEGNHRSSPQPADLHVRAGRCPAEPGRELCQPEMVVLYALPWGRKGGEEEEEVERELLLLATLRLLCQAGVQ